MPTPIPQGFVATSCLLCGPGAPDAELYPADFDPRDLNPEIFSARRLPDRRHYRMVRCRSCGLVRSDPVAEQETLAMLYRESTFDYSDELSNIRASYGRYLARLRHLAGRAGSLLEVGCGNGFMLEEALEQGFAEVRGVEPSSDAVARANPSVRSSIVLDIMRSGLFAPASFDAVCFFQTFDHLPDPAATLGDAVDALRAGGHVLLLNHDVAAVSARMMRERSPIIDIEHTYLFSKATLGELCRRTGLQVITSESARNTYTLRYLWHLLPLPGPVKRAGLRALDRGPGRHLRLTVPLGNLVIIARKPTT